MNEAIGYKKLTPISILGIIKFFLILVSIAVSACSNLDIHGGIGHNVTNSFGGDTFGILQACTAKEITPLKVKPCLYHLSDPFRESNRDTQVNGYMILKKLN